MSTIFRTQPKHFTSPADPIGYDIEGVSASIANCNIGDTDFYDFSFVFYTYPDNVWTVKDGANRNVYRLVNIPGLGAVELLSLFFSAKAENVYYAAYLLGQAYGYTLLPIEEQDSLLPDFIL
jgi:hypothetical protein